ncbi:hypothetical protein AKJ09_09352 [Labilithrix luteola]|uniref:BNR repeat domain protein n=1 Tax=Labilithrix luteola TaxID=1391654 RepID=A0A0K1QAB7_9BACT|nr:hypothetical protein [Labilithrix luteola]AKV02689.1 hypothetical protein AKJ09_09352 [Labilithrix luteola]
MKSRSLLLLALGTGFVVSAFACSETSDAPAWDSSSDDTTDASRPDASLPETSASVEDASVPDVVEPYDGSPAPVACDGSPCVVRLVGGPSVFCGVIDDGTVRCWGEPSLVGGAPDDGSDPNPGPAAIAGIAGAIDIAITSSNVCAVLGDGGVDCWDAVDRTPVRSSDAPSTLRLALGAEMSCAVALNGDLDCWGDSALFGSGLRTVGLGGRKAVDVAVTDTAAFVLDDEGTLCSWGARGVTLGRSTSLDVDDVPRPVVGLPPVRSFAASASHVCAVTTDGRLFCWGNGTNGLLGVGHARDESEPADVSFAQGDWPFQISAADSHSCARLTNGEVACWGGGNTWGELGFATRSAAYVPSKLTTLAPDIVAVATGLSSSCALTKGGAVWCWGDDRSGQLGQGKEDSSRHWTPTQVTFP